MRILQQAGTHESTVLVGASGACIGGATQEASLSHVSHGAQTKKGGRPCQPQLPISGDGTYVQALPHAIHARTLRLEQSMALLRPPPPRVPLSSSELHTVASFV